MTFIPDLNTGNKYGFFNDFENLLVGSIFASSVSGTGGAVASSDGEVGRPGIISLTSGTQSSGRAGISTAVTAHLLNPPITLNFSLKIPVLSDGSNTFVIQAGFLDTLTADQTDGVYFEHDISGHATNWRYCSSNNASRTKNSSSVAISTSGWMKLTIEIYTGPVAKFCVNGTLLGTINTNIPTGSGRMTGVGIAIRKSVGTSARLIYLDYISCDGVLPER